MTLSGPWPQLGQEEGDVRLLPSQAPATSSSLLSLQRAPGVFQDRSLGAQAVAVVGLAVFCELGKEHLLQQNPEPGVEPSGKAIGFQFPRLLNEGVLSSAYTT